jgi:predicted esterase YcpF (UPF0227 family)
MNDAAGVPVSHLLYLHGFRSSPLSTKARKVAAWVAAEHPDVVWCCPQLPASPRAAFDAILQAVDGWPSARMAVIGSSLGGYYATALAERTGCRAVLLNPAIHPARDLATQIGETTAWHSAERFEFRPEYIDELRDLEVGPLSHPERCFAVIAKGDEVLSWREMTERYRGSRIKLLEGSDHALSDFDDQLPDVVRFLGLAG